MNPIQVDLVVLGLQENDDKKFFENKTQFANSNQTYQFNLDCDGNNYWINFKIFSKILKNNILKNVNQPKNKYLYYIYNKQKEKFTFINTSKLRQTNNFYPIKIQEHILGGNYLAIKVQLQLKYSDYQDDCVNICKIDAAIENIKSKCVSIEELQNEKNRLLKIIEDQKKIADQNGIFLGMQEKIDIALLYSHPLINENNEALKNFPVSYKEEYEGLTNIKANKKIKYLITQASLNNLKFVLQSDPQIIHIASHGNYKHYKDEFKFSFLQFENQCKSYDAYTYQLNQIIEQNYMTNLKLIFLNSCQSNEIAKKISQYASTIAVTQEEKIDDKIALEFALEFYNNLLLKQKNFEDSFQQAQEVLLQKYEDIKDIKNSNAQKEILKFQIIPREGKTEVDFLPGMAQNKRQINLNRSKEFQKQEKLISNLYRGLENQLNSLNSLLPNKNTLIIQIILKNYNQDEEKKALQLVTKAYQYFIQREPPFYIAAANECQFPQDIEEKNITEIDQYFEQFQSICIQKVTSQSFDEKFNKICEIASKNICIIITSEKITEDYVGIKFFNMQIDQL